MSNPNPPNKFKKGEPRPAGAGRRPGVVNHLTTARVKTERKVRVVYQTVDEARARVDASRGGPRGPVLWCRQRQVLKATNGCACGR